MAKGGGGGGGNAQSGRAKKAANAATKATEKAAAEEAREAALWEDDGEKKGGGKGKESKAEKKALEARKKAERQALLEEEEAGIPDGGKKSAPKAGKTAKKNAPPASTLDDAIASFSASNIDDALDAMSLVTEKSDKATLGAKAASIEQHPERRFKAAFEAFKEREMPRIKEEKPGMRKQQYDEALFLEFKKHPSNPFNMQSVKYDATKQEKLEALEAKRKQIEQRLGS